MLLCYVFHTFCVEFLVLLCRNFRNLHNILHFGLSLLNFYFSSHMGHIFTIGFFSFFKTVRISIFHFNNITQRNICYFFLLHFLRLVQYFYNLSPCHASLACLLSSTRFYFCHFSQFQTNLGYKVLIFRIWAFCCCTQARRFKPFEKVCDIWLLILFFLVLFDLFYLLHFSDWFFLFCKTKFHSQYEGWGCRSKIVCNTCNLANVKHIYT